jgi:hypothetical protein
MLLWPAMLTPAAMQVLLAVCARGPYLHSMHATQSGDTVPAALQLVHAPVALMYCPAEHTHSAAVQFDAPGWRTKPRPP